jgi:ribosomal protein S18 acetylase RimI-like enzyme
MYVRGQSLPKWAVHPVSAFPPVSDRTADMAGGSKGAKNRHVTTASGCSFHVINGVAVRLKFKMSLTKVATLQSWILAMTLQIEPRHDLSPNELDAIEDRLYDHNSSATGRHDGRGLGFVIRDDAGQMVGVAAGYTWAGTSELKQMWIDEAYRGRGYARALINAFVEEARSRGVRRIWVASYDFQAPGMYEKAGFRRVAEFEGWPEGHVNILLCKTL